MEIWVSQEINSWSKHHEYKPHNILTFIFRIYILPHKIGHVFFFTLILLHPLFRVSCLHSFSLCYFELFSYSSLLGIVIYFQRKDVATHKNDEKIFNSNVVIFAILNLKLDFSCFSGKNIGISFFTWL